MRPRLLSGHSETDVSRRLLPLHKQTHARIITEKIKSKNREPAVNVPGKHRFAQRFWGLI